MRRIAPFLILLTLLAACSDFPDLDTEISPEARAAAYPTLVPVKRITDRAQGFRGSPEDGKRLAARAAALKARARLLRGVAIDDDTRRRLSPTLTRLGG